MAAGRVAKARAASDAAALASKLAADGPALFERDASGRMGFAYQSDAGQTHRTTARIWRIVEATEGKEDRALAEHAAEQVRFHRGKADFHLALVPTTLGGSMLPERQNEIELGRRVEQRSYTQISSKDAERKALENLASNPRYYTELNATFGGGAWQDASTEHSAAQALAELEAVLKRNPPGTTTADEIAAFFAQHGARFKAALVALIHKTRQDAADDTPERRALKLSLAAERALRSLRTKRIERLGKLLNAGPQGFAPHQVSAHQELAAWTRELDLFEQWDLVTKEGWHYRLTPLGTRILEIAQERKASKQPRSSR